MNLKRVRRLYRLDGLQLRVRVRRRKHIALHRGPAPTPTGPTERWSMDFVHGALADGRPFRVLTVVDQWSRQSPILEVASRSSSHFNPTFPIWLPRIGQILHPLALDRMFLSPEPHLLTPATAT